MLIPYATLMSELDIATASELEQLVIQAVYSGLMHARMDQREQTVEVSHCSGRDVRADGAYLHDMLQKLTAWLVEQAAPCRDVLPCSDDDHD